MTRSGLARLRRAGWEVALIETRPTTPHGLLATVAQSLRFPGWFGGNWDALDDCLADLSWWPARRGHVIVLRGPCPGAGLLRRAVRDTGGRVRLAYSSTSGALHRRHDRPRPT